MEHWGDLSAAVQKHTSSVAARYGALTAQVDADNEAEGASVSASTPHPLDESEQEDD